MERTYNGSYGEVKINVEDPEDQKNILIFDDDHIETNNQGLKGYFLAEKVKEYVTGLKYSDNGWKPKTIFVANRNEQLQSTFNYTYN